ncbi:MAG: response regulator [Burkholderiales bacterium]|jgi:DNA-binding NtrC family response regulator|nr:response regulator [Burkholderiales bacterium]
MANILVVDDEIGIRELLSEILGDEGHEVQVAENAQQARLKRDALTPDLVLLDIWMPDTDGVTLLKEWASKGLLTMPVVMMSGHGTIDTAVEATRIGAMDFLEKPIALQKLLNTVSDALNRVRKQKEVNQEIAAFRGMAMAQAAQAPVPEVKSPLELAMAAMVELDLSQQLREVRDQFEKIYFEFHLNQENGSMTRLAEKTGIERTHLYRKLKQLGVEATRGSRRI